jgi:hypothetical protein
MEKIETPNNIGLSNYLQKVYNFLTINQVVGSFIFGFIIVFVYSSVKNIRIYTCDSAIYWQLGSSFSSAKGFSFLNYPATYRGYFFPFVLNILQDIGHILFSDHIMGFVLGISIFTSLVITVALPVFYRLLARSCGHDSTNNHNAYKVGKAKSSLLEIK